MPVLGAHLSRSEEVQQITVQNPCTDRTDLWDIKEEIFLFGKRTEDQPKAGSNLHTGLRRTTQPRD